MRKPTPYVLASLFAFGVGLVTGSLLTAEPRDLTTVQPLADFPGGHGVRLRAYNAQGTLVADYAASMDDPLSVAFDF